jgi:hypothetical protein
MTENLLRFEDTDVYGSIQDPSGHYVTADPLGRYLLQELAKRDFIVFLLLTDILARYFLAC